MEKTGEVALNIEQPINELFELGRLPIKEVNAGRVLYRVQAVKHVTANYFQAPNELQKLGRYNDPLFVKRVWYGTELPTGALAETFGRLRSSQGRCLGTVINQAELNSYNMCEVEVLQPLKLLDLRLLLTWLGLTSDEITSSSYTLTHEIVRVVSRLPNRPFDGIAYESRHHPDGSMCYALWTDPDEPPLVSTGRIVNLCSYVYAGKLATAYSGSDIDAEEMLTEILGYLVT